MYKACDILLSCSLSLFFFPLELSLSEHEKEQQANKEREKGNEVQNHPVHLYICNPYSSSSSPQAFRAGDYKEALVYYSRSVSFYSSAAAHNNKALTLNKLGRYEEAISSCNDVLNIEPNNTKGTVQLVVLLRCACFVIKYRAEPYLGIIFRCALSLRLSQFMAEILSINVCYIQLHMCMYL